ncbi:MAG: Hydrolase, TatD family [Candidatus Nomurabacteria bacterium GW2011_GWB1_43_7]|uniref:Hydrolase, TatD family n=1 Tax=Candidatus Nomurabacteria bacterium GW2011_GWB1_43_7 TaxID=1618747 RepID=A0A0G1HFS9_9BACT|nr:MAG: Hydrolase, TatD family [Candidatus Nomurabacteria bacterium GW2011_GWB1_43_7]
MTPKYIDIHSHVNFTAFDADRDDVIKRALDNDTWMINVGTQIDTSKKAVELANKYKEGVYATVGLHPIHTGKSFHDEQELGSEGKEFTSRGEAFDKEKYLELARNLKVVAIGECGLDYYRTEPESIEKQKKIFIEQIGLANETNKPLMLHVRDAYADTLGILKEHAKVKGVVHFFVGSIKEAKEFLDLGFMLSFTGVLTFTHDYDEVVRLTPLDMILSDTDSPYVAPVPYRGKRNEPSYVKEIVKRIAEIKNLPEEKVAEAIVANAKKIFTI